MTKSTEDAKLGMKRRQFLTQAHPKGEPALQDVVVLPRRSFWGGHHLTMF